MGKRGWIYNGNSPGSIGAGALAAMEIASILEPEVEHVIEEIRSEKARGKSHVTRGVTASSSFDLASELLRADLGLWLCS